MTTEFIAAFTEAVDRNPSWTGRILMWWDLFTPCYRQFINEPIVVEWIHDNAAAISAYVANRDEGYRP